VGICQFQARRILQARWRRGAQAGGHLKISSRFEKPINELARMANSFIGGSKTWVFDDQRYSWSKKPGSSPLQVFSISGRGAQEKGPT